MVLLVLVHVLLVMLVGVLHTRNRSCLDDKVAS